jgi:hypothetical protein
MIVKCLSLWQPWASAMFTYEVEDRPVKTIETRHWPIYVPSGGCALAIHAAKQKYRRQDYDGDFAYMVSSLKIDNSYMPYGAVLGIVWLDSCKKADELINMIGPTERMFGNYVNEDDNGDFQQRYGFVTDPSRIRILRQPYTLRGMQGVFTWDMPEGLEFK